MRAGPPYQEICTHVCQHVQIYPMRHQVVQISFLQAEA